MEQPQDPEHKFDRISSVPRLSVRGAIVAGAFGGLLYAVNFAFQVFVGIFNLTGATSILSGITVPFLIVIACRINRQWGTATAIWTLYSALAIPTVLMGPPGTYKLLVGLIGGFAYDLAFCTLKCRPFAVYPALVAYVAALAGGFYLVFAAGWMPAVSGGTITTVLLTVCVIFLTEGFVSTYLASRFFTSRVEPMLT